MGIEDGALGGVHIVDPVSQVYGDPRNQETNLKEKVLSVHRDGFLPHWVIWINNASGLYKIESEDLFILLDSGDNESYLFYGRNFENSEYEYESLNQFEQAEYQADSTDDKNLVLQIPKTAVAFMQWLEESRDDLISPMKWQQ